LRPTSLFTPHRPPHIQATALKLHGERSALAALVEAARARLAEGLAPTEVRDLFLPGARACVCRIRCSDVLLMRIESPNGANVCRTNHLSKKSVIACISLPPTRNIAAPAQPSSSAPQDSVAEWQRLQREAATMEDLARRRAEVRGWALQPCEKNGDWAFVQPALAAPAPPNQPLASSPPTARPSICPPIDQQHTASTRIETRPGRGHPRRARGAGGDGRAAAPKRLHPRRNGHPAAVWRSGAVPARRARRGGAAHAGAGAARDRDLRSENRPDLTFNLYMERRALGRLLLFQRLCSRACCVVQ
jgi:hypothetical protein